MSKSHRKLVEETLTKQRSDRLWTANHYGVLPISPQPFDIGGILPAILYMFRWGERRGKGGFINRYGSKATVDDVVSVLIEREDEFAGFDDEVGKEILGDLYMAFCVENKQHKIGRKEPVQRVYATHFFSSWVDLPKDVVNLRRVPEFLVSVLSNDNGSCFPLAASIEENELLRIFGRYTEIRGEWAGNQASDTFNDSIAEDIGIDELLMIRMAQQCGGAPAKLRGQGRESSVATPIARRSADVLREDISAFVAGYGDSIPRQSFQRMLESGIGFGIVNLLFSTFQVLSHWKNSGEVLSKQQQTGLPLFVDCSHGQDPELRDISESVMRESQSSYETLPIIMMLLRVLEEYAASDRRLREEVAERQGENTDLLQLLGDLYNESHPHSERLMDRIDGDCLALAEALAEQDELPQLIDRLRAPKNPALRLAEGLCELMGDTIQRRNYQAVLESALMTGESHGLAIKRRVQRTIAGKRKSMDLKTIAFNAELIEFLVHRYLYDPITKTQAPLFLHEFLGKLMGSYGVYIAEAPPGYPISQQLLQRNKGWFERQLRDLGLLVGVNDAETMKQLRPRYVL